MAEPRDATRPRPTTGDTVAAVLETCGVTAAFGVISVHNLAILDAIGRRGRIRFVPARGEAGAVNMADGHARVRDALGVAVTSTGTGCGNAAGALVEARTAETPLLHLTGQVDTAHLGRGHGFIHETPEQIEMLAAVSKAAYRVNHPGECAEVLREAVAAALTAPRGPVSVEIPADVQGAAVDPPDTSSPRPAPPAPADEAALDRLAARIAAARRPLLWLGGGARHAGAGALRLAEMGVGIVTSVRGRGTVPEDHPLTLGAFNQSPDVEAFYATSDLLVVAGSRLRSNDTRTYRLRLPSPRVQVDVDPAARGRLAYAAEEFVQGAAAAVLVGVADRLDDGPGNAFRPDPVFADDLRRARADAEDRLRNAIAPYDGLADALAAGMGRDSVWVRDITVANSTWGNRLLKVYGPRNALHPAGGGIGQGTAMAIGAAVAAPGRKVVCLTGDGGLVLNMGELMTAAETGADLALVVMNDRGYGVIRNIQDAEYGGRRRFVGPRDPRLRRSRGGLRPRLPAPRLPGRVRAHHRRSAGPTRAAPHRGRHDRDRPAARPLRRPDGRPLVAPIPAPRADRDRPIGPPTAARPRRCTPPSGPRSGLNRPFGRRVASQVACYAGGHRKGLGIPQGDKDIPVSCIDSSYIHYVHHDRLLVGAIPPCQRYIRGKLAIIQEGSF